MNRVCVITPTIGRPTLINTINSVKRACNGSDYHIIVWDNITNPEVGAASYAPGEPVIVNWPYGCHGSVVGNVQRDAGIELARLLQPAPDFLVFIDDDDELCPEAIEVLRTADTEKVHLFSMQWSTDPASKSEPNLFQNQIGGPQVVWPMYCKDRFPRWHATNQYHSDWLCAEELIKAQPFHPRYHSELICKVRPNG